MAFCIALVCALPTLLTGALARPVVDEELFSVPVPEKFQGNSFPGIPPVYAPNVTQRFLQNFDFWFFLERTSCELKRDPAGHNYMRHLWKAFANEQRGYCDELELVGGATSPHFADVDGHKHICATDLRVEAQKPGEPCVVVSLGSNDDFSFENAIHARYPHCRIVTVDCLATYRNLPPFVELVRGCLTGGEAARAVRQRGQEFHMMTLRNLNRTARIPYTERQGGWRPRWRPHLSDLVTYRELLRLLQVERPTLLKMDIEQAEFLVVPDMNISNAPVQLSMEVHTGWMALQHRGGEFAHPAQNVDRGLLRKFFARLFRALNYGVVKAEVNPGFVCGCEFTLRMRDAPFRL